MEEQKETEIRLQDLWLILKSCWWQCLIVLVVLAVVIYMGLSLVHENEYTAQVSLYVLTTPGGEDNDKLSTSAISIANALIDDCEILIKSTDQVLQPAIDNGNFQFEVKDLRKMLKITTEEDARVIYLSVTTSDPQSSANIANEVCDQACNYFNGMYAQKLLSVVDHAKTPTTPSNPISLTTVFLISAVGAILVYGIYFLKFILDDKINNAEDVEKYLGLSMLGVIPNKYESGRKKSKNGYYYSYTANGTKTRE